MASDLYVSMAGSDTAGTGTLQAPFATVARALAATQPGDTVILRGGTYSGGFRVDNPNITIRSRDGEWAVITAPTNDEDKFTETVDFNVDASGGRLQRLEIVGGYYLSLIHI